MKKVKVNWKDFPWHSLVFFISTVAMIGLGVAGFCVPPLGYIDPTVFQYGSLICVPIVVSQIKPVLAEAHYFKTSVGPVTVEATGKGKQPSDPPPNEEA